MTLHIFGPSFSSLVRSVRLYCLEKGLEATCGMTINRRPVAMHSETHRLMHPFGQVPVLVHGEQHVFETLAICRYLDRELLSETSTSSHTNTLVDQWANALVTTVDRCVVRNYLLKVAGPKPDATFCPEALCEARIRVNETLAILEAQLGEKAFLCGADFSVADALLAPMLDYLNRLPEQNWQLPTPQLDHYLACIRQRPSGKAVLQNPDFATA